MFGVIMSIIAGASMSVQGVFNTRLSEKVGTFEANAIVQGTAFILGLIVMFIFRKGDLGKISEVNKLYLFGGVLGIIITITVMLAIKNLNPTYGISIILIAQLLVAAIIDAFGLFGSEKMTFGWAKFAGLGLMIAGVLLFKLKS